MLHEHWLHTDHQRYNMGDAIKQCMAIWCQQHRLMLGAPYMIQYGKDQRLMKQIIDTYDTNKTTTMIILFFAEFKTDEFLKKTGATIGVFKTQIPKLLVKATESQDTKQTGRL